MNRETRPRPRRPAAGRALGSAGVVGPAVAGIALAAGDLHRPVPRRQGTRRAGGGARPPRHARACLPRRRRPHAPSAGPAGPGPRAADRGAPPRLVLQAVPPCDGASAHVAPSREESWSQSAVVALGLGVSVVGTAVDGLAHTLGNGRGVLVPPDHPHALAAALSRVLAGCCWNTTTSAPAPSTRCGWSPMTRSWCGPGHHQDLADRDAGTDQDPAL